MKNLSKSRYTLFRQCSKALWLRIYNPDVATEDKALEARFAEGNVIGDLAMGGSFSIKSVLPALFPGDSQLDYHALSGLCQNGGDAMNLFPSIAKMAPADAAAAREALLRYCELDTLAMVKVWEILKDASICKRLEI